MTTCEFLQQLRMREVRVWADGNRLRVNAPRSVLTAELQAELAARKVEIREFLASAPVRRSSLVPINPSGSRPTFYGVPSDGDVFSYLELARQLGPDQPFYAFEAPGIDGAQPPLTSIEGLAAHYLADLRAFQPDGPYYIGGFCLGGIVAFELARQIRARGQDVALLALFESPSPHGLKSWHRPAARFRRRRAEISARVRELSGQGWPERLAFVRSRLARILGHSNPTGAGEEARSRVFHATQRAACTYVREARTYPGRIVLFLESQDYSRQFDWGQIAGGGLEVHVGPHRCIDYRMMLRDPTHVHALADFLKPYIQ